MARGDNREPLFLEERDYRVYTALLRQAARRYRFEFHAYCLMPNHIHVLARSTDPNLSEMMEWLQGIYARWFNRVYDRVGHVFQGRFLAKIIKTEAYLFEVGRYIHMNPVKARLCARPEEHPWSSMAQYLGGKDQWICREALLDCGPEAFHKFTVARSEVETDERGWPRCRDWYEESDSPEIEGSAELSDIPPEPEEDWPERLAAEMDCSLESLRKGWDRAFIDRRRAALLALRDATTLKLAEIAPVLGYRTVKSAANALTQARGKAKSDPGFRSLVEEVKSGIGGTFTYGRP